jgi:hypothetical protein
LKRKSAYAYTLHEGRIESLEAEARAARSLGFDAEVVRPAPLPFATAAALRFANQAQFNPASYVIGLGAAVRDRGGRIHEQTRINKVEKRPGHRWRVQGRSTLRRSSSSGAGHQYSDRGANPFRQADAAALPHCHGVSPDPTGILDGMFIEVDQPSHSLRMGRDREGPLLVALGASFPTGHEGDIAKKFRELDEWVRAHVPYATQFGAG